MNKTATSAAAAPGIATPMTFDNLRKHLSRDTAGPLVLDELAAASADLERAGAKHAAARLLQVDEYATALPPETLPRIIGSDSILDELEVVTGKSLGFWALARNVFALVPLLITWFSLSLATNAYHEEIQQDPNQVYQPFLALWQTGFDHRMWLTFSIVAAADTVLFLGIIGMTGVIHWQEHAAHVRAGRLAARVDHAITALVATLGKERWRVTHEPGEWAAEVGRVIDRAMEETRALNQANQQALESAKLAIQEAKQSHTELIRALGAEVVETLKAVRAENTHLLEETARELRDMLAQAFAAQKQVADDSLVAVTEARHATEMYHQSASTLASSIGKIGDVAEKLGANAATFAETAKTMDEHVRSMTDSQERFAGKLADAATATRGAVDHMSGAVDHMSSASEQMQATTTRVSGLLEAVSGTLSPQLQHMGAQVVTASDALSQTQSRLAKTSADLARAAEFFRNMPPPKVTVALFGKSSS